MPARARPGEKLARIRELVRKEFIQIRRDPRLFRIVIIAPIIQLMVFGYAVSTDIRHTATFVVDHDRTERSRDLVNAFVASGYFEVKEPTGWRDTTESEGPVLRQLAEGRIPK